MGAKFSLPKDSNSNRWFVRIGIKARRSIEGRVEGLRCIKSSIKGLLHTRPTIYFRAIFFNSNL